jgi:hypothetical protein
MHVVATPRSLRKTPQHSHYWFGPDSGLYKESELFSVFLSDLGVATTWTRTVHAEEACAARNSPMHVVATPRSLRKTENSSA